MPAIFHLELPVSCRSATALDSETKPERGSALPYTGRLSFDGTFDRFGFAPQRELRSTAGPSPARTVGSASLRNG